MTDLTFSALNLSQNDHVADANPNNFLSETSCSTYDDYSKFINTFT